MNRLIKVAIISLGIVLLSMRAHCQPALTTIQDVLYKADGSPFQGFLTIQWKSFDAADTSKIGTQNVRLRVIHGLLYVRLVPTTNASPGTYYEVVYNSEGRNQFTETWAVPPTANTLRVRDVRASSTGTGGGAAPLEIADIPGLPAELEVRPVRGPGFAPSRAAIINSFGAIEGATGSLSDCVRVDGSSGPCGGAGGGTGASATFVDSDSPQGALNGTNAEFLLAQEPNPGSSLLLWRNGVLQKQGVDYSLNSRTATFLAGNVPQAGDILQASYRTSGSGAIGATTAFVDAETPSGTANGVNTAFLLTETPNPPSSLFLYRNGLLQLPGTDFTLSANQITFLPEAIPQSGDVLVAAYRMYTLGGTSGQVLCSGPGTATTATTLASLGNCTIPGDVLRTGDRVEIHFDYEHIGAASGFQFAVRWGATVLAARTGVAADELATGKAGASIHGAGTQWSSQSWTSTQTAVFGLGKGTESPAAPIVVDFLGAVASAGGDSVSLRNLSVVRYPAP